MIDLREDYVIFSSFLYVLNIRGLMFAMAQLGQTMMLKYNTKVKGNKIIFQWFPQLWRDDKLYRSTCSRKEYDGPVLIHLCLFTCVI